MKLVSGIVDSGFFAQSALSAEVATKDSLGRNISETYLTGVDLTPYQTTAGMTAYQSAGDYLTTADSANFYTTANESGFITGVDLTPYQEKADMTAYQPAGSYLTTADSANFYTTANESGFISEVPAGTMNESAFGYDANDKISGYNGSAFAGGSDVPEGVMVESGLEYNAINQISGYNGSAIAQYGHEAQWLVHDDTLVHASNSAQYALGCNISALQRLMGIDETVLYENANGGVVNMANTFTLNESLQNFEMIKIIDNSLPVGGDRRLTTIPVSTATISIATNDAWFDVSYNPTAGASKYIGANFYSANAEGTQIAANGSYIKNMAATGAWTNRNEGRLYKIIGVHRISG